MGRFTDLAFGKPPKVEEPIDEPRVEEEVHGDEDSE